MAQPGVPQPRKTATNNFNPKNANAQGNGSVSKANYKRQSVSPFSNPGKGAYVRRGVGASPSNVPTNDSDAGNNAYRAPGNNKGPKNYGGGLPNNGQPFNNPGVRRGSRTMKGVD